MQSKHKGDKELFNVTGAKLTEDTERTTDEYDLTEQLNSEELKKFEGEVALHTIWEIGQSVKDSAGNLLGKIPEKAETEFPAESECTASCARKAETH